MLLPPKAQSLLIATNVAALCAIGYLLLAAAAPPRARFRELSAERIDIVDRAGRTVLAISNKERIAAPVVDGKTYPVGVSEGRELMAGMIFFNQDGDEMGGLVFNSFRRPDGKAAGIGHLSFDRFRDNQVLALQYKENATTVQSGLTLYDRPGDGSFARSLDLIAEAQEATPERRMEIGSSLSAMSKGGELGVERVFLGSKNREAQLLLKDSKGRVRARLILDERDDARLEFLDDSGRVTARFPG
jgi:hypothetical protein